MTGPAALPRGVAILLGGAAATVTVAGIHALRDIAGPVFLALVLTVCVSPLGHRLQRRGAPAWLSTAATATGLLLILAVVAGSIAVSLIRLGELLPSYQDQLDRLPDVAVDAGGVVQDLLGGVVAAVTDLVFLVALLLFMSIDAARFPARLSQAARHRPRVVDALRTFGRGTRRYLVVTTVFGLIVATVDTLLLWALGVPLPVLWGLLSFVTNYIPNIGFVIGLLPPALLGLMEGGPRLMAAVIVLYCAVNFVIQSVIQPKVVGDQVGLSPTVTFLSLVFWGWVLGPLGALLAVPLTLFFKGLLVDGDPGARWIDPLISN